MLLFSYGLYVFCLLLFGVYSVFGGFVIIVSFWVLDVCCFDCGCCIAWFGCRLVLVAGYCLV